MANELQTEGGTERFWLKARRIVLSLVLLGSAPLVASSGNGPFLDVSPSQPEDDEIVSFVLSGTWNSTCTPKFSDGHIGSWVIEVFYVTGHNCGRAFTDYEERVWTEDPLEAGRWRVRAIIDGKLRAEREFTVVPTAHSSKDSVQFRSEKVSFDEDSHTAFVTVVRTGTFHGEISVDFRTEDGKARAGEDYEHTQDRLTWRHGDHSPKTLSIRLFDDFDFEGDEHFYVTLEHASGAAIGHPGKAKVTIADDETAHSGGACRADENTLCLQNGRFEVTLRWRTQQGKKGHGNQGTFTDETGYFWFFSNKNIEVLVKILDGCSLNDSYWVYVAGLTNIWVEVVIRDTETGEVKTWKNPMGQSFRPIEDTGYFDCRVD